MQQPEKYESNKGLALQDNAEFIPKLISKMKFTKNQHILDFGAGAGSTTNKYIIPIAQQYNSDIIGVDISDKMLNYAREKFAHNSIEYINADIMNEHDYNCSPAFQRKYGSIFSFYVIHHIKNYEEAIRRLSNLLEPGGFIAITVFTFGKLYQLYQKLISHPDWSQYMKELIVPDWTENNVSPTICIGNALEAANLEIHELELHERKYEFPDIGSIADLYLTCNPMIHKIPTDLMPKFKEEYVKAIKGWHTQEPNRSTVVHPYDMLTLLAKKKELVNEF